MTREAALVVALDYMGGGVVPDELVELEGSHRDLVRGAERVRDVAPGEELTVTVYVRRDPGAHPVADPTAEAQKRPQDRRYLTPSEVEESFGASQSDLQAVVDYAKSKGLHTSDASKVKRSVRVTGRPERSARPSESSSGTSSTGTSATVAGSAR